MAGFSVYTPNVPFEKRYRGPNKADRSTATPAAGKRVPLAPISPLKADENARAAAPATPNSSTDVSNLTESVRLANAINILKQNGFSTVFQFINAFLGATEQQQKAAASRLINQHGTEILDHFYARRPELVQTWIASVNGPTLEKEVKRLAETLRPKYGQRVAQILDDFGVDRFIQDAEKHAPTLCAGLRSAGAMPEHSEAAESRKEYRVILATVLSMLCYSQNEKASSFRLTMSIFLLASSASRGLFDVLHHAGVCLSYTQTIERVKELGVEQLQRTLYVVQASVVMVIWDNLNIAFKVGQQRLDSKDHFDNGTTATMIPLFGVKRGELPLELLSPITTSTPNLTFRLEADFLPSAETCKALQDVHLWHLEDILFTHFPELRERFKGSIKAPPTDLAIPVHKTEQYPLPAMHIDESSIEGTIEVLNKLLKQLGLDSEDALKEHGVVFGASDLLSLELLLKAAGGRRESMDLTENLGKFMKGQLGLFHTKMAGFRSVVNEFWGMPNHLVPWSLWRMNAFLGRKSIVAGWSAKKLPPFGPATELVLDLCLPANVLDAFRLHCGTGSLEKWVETVQNHAAMTEVAHKVYCTLFSARKVSALREQVTRDLTLENIMLFNRDALTMRVLRTAVKAGHVGTVVTVLHHWMVMFRGTGKMPKYASALFQLLIELKTMHPKLRNAFLMNWLVNLTGKPYSFKELDLLQEHQNFWLKVIYASKGVNRSWKWLGMISVSIFILRDVIRQVRTDFNTPYNSTKHSDPSTSQDLAKLRAYLEEKNIQTFTPNRQGNNTVTPARDLMAEGVKYANGGKVVKDFRADRCKARNLGVAVTAPAAGDSDAEEDEHEPEDDGVYTFELGLDDLATDEEEFPAAMSAEGYVSMLSGIITQM